MKKVKKKYLIVVVMFMILISFGISYKIYAKYILSKNINVFHIDKLMEDKVKPTINAIDPNNNDKSLTDEEYYTNKDVKVDYDDNIKVDTAKYWYNENEKTFSGDGKDFDSGIVFTDEGWYKIEIIDIFENKNTVIILIDKTAPTISATSTNTSSESQKRNTSSSVDSDEFKMWFVSDVDISEFDKYGIKVTYYKVNPNEQVFNEIKNQKSDIGKGTINNVWKYTDRNYYRVVATDFCNNTTTLVIGIDKVKPIISTLSENNKKINKNLIIQYSDDFSNIKSAKYAYNANSDNFSNYSNISNNTTLTDDGYYHIILEDNAGNTNEYKIIMDKVAPVISVEADNKEKENYSSTMVDIVKENSDITLNTSDNFAIDYNEFWFNSSSNSFSGNSTRFDNGKKLTDEGYYKIVAHDIFGNTTTIIVLLDKTPPEVTVKYYKKNQISMLTKECINNLFYNVNSLMNGGVING